VSIGAAEGAQPEMTETAPTITTTLRLTWPKVALAAASGVVLFAAFPPLDLGPLAWFALIPLLFVLTQVRPVGGLVLGLVFGVSFLGLFAGFMLKYGFLAWFASVAFQSLFFGLFGLVAAMCNRASFPAVRALSVASAWTLFEMFRGGIGGLGFTVGNLGYTQHDQLPLVQVASMVGHFGLGFFIAAINAAVAQVILAVAPGLRARPRMHPGQFFHLATKTALACYVVVLLMFIWGALILRMPEKDAGDPIEVAAVQASLSDIEGTSVQRAEEALAIYSTLSRTVPDDVELIVWPETAIPVVLNQEQTYADQIAELAVEKSAWIITGAFEIVDGHVYNTLFVFSPEGEMTDSYAKVVLVPFGESVPWAERFPWLRQFALRNVDFSPGDGHRALRIGEHRAGPLICFEALFPHVLRTNVRLGADFMVIGTSDAWAADTYEIEQHSVTAPLRAAESRRYIVRAASWGRSQIIAPDGEVLADVPVGEAGVAWHEIRPRSEPSTYHEWGDLPVQVVCGVLLWLGLAGLPRGAFDETDEDAPAGE
jgi:apolipoprotein N-acyltransferase